MEMLSPMINTFSFVADSGSVRLPHETALRGKGALSCADAHAAAAAAMKTLRIVTEIFACWN